MFSHSLDPEQKSSLRRYCTRCGDLEDTDALSFPTFEVRTAF